MLPLQGLRVSPQSGKCHVVHGAASLPPPPEKEKGVKQKWAVIPDLGGEDRGHICYTLSTCVGNIS